MTLAYPSRLDLVALTFAAVAFTTLRRVGTFLPASTKLAKNFSWILPSFIRHHADSETMLIWIPKHKGDPTGKGFVLTVKPTYDSCCPINLVLRLLEGRGGNAPLFTTPTRIPLQSWLLGWMRRRMAELGKKPNLYSLRSIRQGATTTASEVDMPEVFLRASGG